VSVSNIMIAQADGECWSELLSPGISWAWRNLWRWAIRLSIFGARRAS